MAQNPFFNPQTQQGLRSLHQLTKWLIDKLDETGLSSFLPDVPGEQVHTPEEENARFMQGETGEPEIHEDHQRHISVHREMLIDNTIPDEIRENVAVHIKEHVRLAQLALQQQLMLNQSGVNLPAGQAPSAMAGMEPRQQERETASPFQETATIG